MKRQKSSSFLEGLNVVILSIIGWLAIVAGCIAVWVGLSDWEVFWAAMGFSSIVSGILFLALDKGLSLLAEIRDALTDHDQAGVDAGADAEDEPYF